MSKPMAKKHLPVHPGEILFEEFMKPLALTKYRLAKETGMPADRVGRIVAGTRAITGDTALRLARFLGTTPGFWMNLQSRYELDTASDAAGAKIEKQVRPWKAA
jgi:addiction module HigA family antidote